MTKLIKFFDYERIYKVINSIINNEGADPSVCCVFFSAFGARILSDHFGMNVQVKSGIAAYHLGNDENILLFGQPDEKGDLSAEHAFHCWVEVDGWAVDFMSPSFSLYERHGAKYPPKMFQKPLDQMSESPLSLMNAGEFYLQSTPEYTQQHMRILGSSQAYDDLASLCSTWFEKHPKRMQKDMTIANAAGEQTTTRLTGKPILSAW